MVYILNNLPQNLSGTTTSGNNRVFFSVNPNYEQSNVAYQHFTYPTKKIFSTSIDFEQTYSFSIEDHPGNPLPMSAVASTTGEIIFFYMDIEQGYQAVKVTYPNGITPHEEDHFANIGKMVFAIFYNDQKYFYSCNLLNEHTFIRRTDAFNTNDGTESGSIREYAELGILFNYCLVSMGGKNGYLVFYYWDSEQNLLTYKNSYTETSYTPYGVGSCKVIQKDEIFGAGCTYRSGGSDLFNIRYLCTENTDHTISVIPFPHLMMKQDKTIIRQGYTSDRSNCSIYNGKLQAIFGFGNEQTSVFDIFGKKGTYFWTSAERNYVQMTFPILEELVVVFENRTLLLYSIGVNSITNTTTLLTMSNHSVVCKLPGIPGVYYDADRTNEAEKPKITLGYLRGYHYYLPEGSMINQELIQPYGSENWALTNQSLTIQLSENALTKKIYSNLGNGKSYRFD